MQVSEFENGQIKADTKLQLIVLSVFFLVWAGMSVGITIAIYPEMRFQQLFDRLLAGGSFLERDLKMLVLLFPVALLFFIKPLYQFAVIHARYKNARITLDPFPGSSYEGGQVAGYLDVNHLQVPNPNLVNITVNCISVRKSRSSNGSSSHEHIKWRQKAVTRINQMGRNSYRINFSTTLDESMPSSSEEADSAKIIWKVKAKVEGTNFDLSFPIPVINNGEAIKSRYLNLDRSDQEASVTQVPSIENVLISETENELLLQYNRARKSGMAIILLLVGMVMIGVTIFMVFETIDSFSGARPSMFSGLITSMIGFVFGLFGVLLFVWGIFMRLSRLAIQITSSEVVSTRYLLGNSWESRIFHKDIAEIKKKVSAQSGQGADAKVYYDISAQMSNNSKVTLADHIKGQEEADRLLHLLMKHISLNPDTVVESKVKQPMPPFVKYIIYTFKFMGYVITFGIIAAFVYDFM